MIRRRTKPYFINLLLAIDQVLSAVVGYDADVSISAALGESQWIKYDGEDIAWTRPIQAFLQRALEKTQESHCLKAYLYEIKKRNMSPNDIAAVEYAITRREGAK